MGTAGVGYIDGNASACSEGYTYVCPLYPATEDMLVDEIEINNTDAGTDFEIGVGTLNGTTFTPRMYITLASLPTGVQTFNAPADFTAFEMYEGERIYFYSHGSRGKPDRTSTPNPDECRYASGDKMDSASFTVSSYSNCCEVQFRGDSLGWDKADVDNQDPSDIDEIDGQTLDNIDTIDEL
jgi:hypothetical protein